MYPLLMVFYSHVPHTDFVKKKILPAALGYNPHVKSIKVKYASYI